MNDDGYMNKSVLHEAAQWKKPNGKLITASIIRAIKSWHGNHVSYSVKQYTTMEVQGNDYEPDYRSDMEVELHDESDIQYRKYAMQGGEDYVQN